MVIVGNMKLRTAPTLTVFGLAAVLWVVPSIGTQGMGTIGQRFSHADRTLLEYPDDANVGDAVQVAEVRRTLRRADVEVEQALLR